MVEFQFGLFNNANNTMINSIGDVFQMLTDGKGFGIGAQFHNVSKAQIYGVEISTNGVYNFNKNTKLFYNLGYVYTEPRDADYQERNAVEGLYTDPLQMKEKSNTGKYLKYRPKHSFKNNGRLPVETHQCGCQCGMEKQNPCSGLSDAGRAF